MTEISGIPSSSLSRLLDSESMLAKPKTESNGFGEMLNGMIRNVEQANKEADVAVQGLVTGQAQDLHSVMLAVHKADLSLRLALEVRNKLVDAYHEVMRMTV